MTGTKRYNEWFNQALKDVQGAEILFEHGADYGLVCFHCQQAAEKYLKGYLIYKSGRLYEGHSLVKLCKLAMKYENGFNRFLKDCSFVNSYYIETRFPAEEPMHVTNDEVVECIRIAKEIMGHIPII